MHVHENRVVITYAPEGAPLGLITGKLHDTAPRGFEVDWLVRFPEAPPGTGAVMCTTLLPKIAQHFRLGWIVVKIRDDYEPQRLAAMARRFGFVLQSRAADVAYWRLDLP